MLNIQTNTMAAFVETCFANNDLEFTPGTRLGIRNLQGHHVNIDVITASRFRITFMYYKPDDKVTLVYTKKHSNWYLTEAHAGEKHKPLGESNAHTLTWTNTLWKNFGTAHSISAIAYVKFEKPTFMDLVKEWLTYLF